MMIGYGLGLDLRRRAVAFGLDALENGRGEVGVRRMRSLEKLSGVAGLLRPTFHVGACESQLVSLDAPRDLSCGWEVVRGAQQGTNRGRGAQDLSLHGGWSAGNRSFER